MYWLIQRKWIQHIYYSKASHNIGLGASNHVSSVQFSSAHLQFRLNPQLWAIMKGNEWALSSIIINISNIFNITSARFFLFVKLHNSKDMWSVVTQMQVKFKNVLWQSQLPKFNTLCFVICHLTILFPLLMSIIIESSFNCVIVTHYQKRTSNGNNNIRCQMTNITTYIGNTFFSTQICP